MTTLVFMVTTWRSGVGAVPDWGPPPATRAPFAFLAAIRASGLPDGTGAEAAAIAVFCALDVRLPPAVATRFLAALPEELRDLFRRWDVAYAETSEGFGRDEYVRRLAEHLEVAVSEADDVTRAVFAGIRRMLSSRAQSAALAKLLPADLAVLWDDEEALADGGAAVPLDAP